MHLLLAEQVHACMVYVFVIMGMVEAEFYTYCGREVLCVVELGKVFII